jgi:DNA-binding PadR family transcriptional regulator
MALRLTVQVRLVLQALLRDPAREMYGLELSEETGLQPGTAYPILLRLEHGDWVTSHWEDIDPRAEKRPARRYYRLTASGAVQASAALAVARRPRGTALRRLAGAARRSTATCCPHPGWR